MATSGAATAPPGLGPAKPSPMPTQSESVREKKDLASWWKNFKRSDKKGSEQAGPITPGIFGVPLQESIRYANVAISLFNDEGQSYIYGYVPIIVAKCGVYLKEKATEVEGIFRLAGSERRIKDLKIAFDSPDRYGKGLDWTGYTVHDAANILRRYFNQLPEPIIPLSFYQRFRDPLRNHQAQAVGAIETQSPSEGAFDAETAIKTYQNLITELPPLNRQLLLYVLDLLAVFASKSDLNKMTTPNLAAIFQPGILNHPQHDMAPAEYRLSQDILIFLIENQDNFLIGMQGTAVDPETVRDVQNGSPKAPMTPTASVRGLRRGASVSSKHSKRSDGLVTPVTATPTTNTSGVHRSNTVPSRRSANAAQSPRLLRDRGSGPSTPPLSMAAGTMAQTGDTMQSDSLQSTPVPAVAATFAAPAPPEVTSASSSEVTTPLATVGSDTSSNVIKDFQTPKKDTTPLLAPSSDKSTERSLSNTPSTAASGGPRKFLDVLKQSPTDGESRKPNKLQKKRIPGTSLSSAQSSNNSLHESAADAPRSPISPRMPPTTSNATTSELMSEQSGVVGASTLPQGSAPQRNPTETTLKPKGSPANSFHSQTDDTSDADLVGDDMPAHGEDASREKKKNRWRFSRANNKVPSPPAPLNPLGTMTAKDHATSRSTIGSTVASSATSQPRKSIQQEPIPLPSVTTDPTKVQPIQSPNTDPVFSDSEREKRGPMSWIRGKLQDRKDKEAEKRSKTPDRHHERSKSKQDLQLAPESASLPTREKSFEQPRGGSVAVSSLPPADDHKTTAPLVSTSARPVENPVNGSVQTNMPVTAVVETNGETTPKAFEATTT